MIKNACTYRITLQLLLKQRVQCSYAARTAILRCREVCRAVHVRFYFHFKVTSVDLRLALNNTLKELYYLPLSYISLFPQWERKRLLRLVTKIIVLTSWGSVTMLCVRCPDHLSITQGSWGRGWGPKWRTSYVHTHTHTHTRCYSSEAWLTKATAKNEASQDRFTHK